MGSMLKRISHLETDLEIGEMVNGNILKRKLVYKNYSIRYTLDHKAKSATITQIRHDKQRPPKG